MGHRFGWAVRFLLEENSDGFLVDFGGRRGK
jgi:hypothetical protein